MCIRDSFINGLGRSRYGSTDPALGRMDRLGAGGFAPCGDRRSLCLVLGYCYWVVEPEVSSGRLLQVTRRKPLTLNDRPYGTALSYLTICRAAAVCALSLLR